MSSYFAKKSVAKFLKQKVCVAAVLLLYWEGEGDLSMRDPFERPHLLLLLLLNQCRVPSSCNMHLRTSKVHISPLEVTFYSLLLPFFLLPELTVQGGNISLEKHNTISRLYCFAQQSCKMWTKSFSKKPHTFENNDFSTKNSFLYFVSSRPDLFYDKCYNLVAI